MDAGVDFGVFCSIALTEVLKLKRYCEVFAHMIEGF